MNHFPLSSISIRYLILVFSLGSLLNLSACRTIPPPEERLKQILASGPECLAPCWNGLMPGHTNVDDLNIKDATFARIRPGVDRYHWSPAKEQDPYFVDVHNGEVMTIGFQLRKDFTPGVIWAQLGEPDSYEAILGIGGEVGTSLSLILFYQSKGIVVDIYIAPFDENIAEIRSTCQVQMMAIQNKQIVVPRIYLTNPATADEMLQVVPTWITYGIREWHSGDAFNLWNCP